MTNLEIYIRVKLTKGLGGMTVNERLYRTGLMNAFEKSIKTNKNLAKRILVALKVDNNSIDEILKK